MDINEEQIITEVETKETPPEKLIFKKDGLFGRLSRELLAISSWVYLVLKVFIFDIDIYLLNMVAPRYLWVLNYKFFIGIGLVAIALLFFRNTRFWRWFFYIMFYPFVIIFFKIPYFVFRQKSWVFAFGIINAIVSFFKSIKYNFIVGAIYLISVCLILNFKNEYLLWAAIITLMFFLVATYIRRFIMVFQSSLIFQIHSDVVSKLKTFTTNQYGLGDEIKNLPVEKLDKEQLEKWTTNLQFNLLFNRGCYFFAKKLKDYQESKFNVIAYVFNLLMLILITVLTFAVINWGLFKIDSSLYELQQAPRFFHFFYYSFSGLVFNSISQVAPIKPLSLGFLMIEEFFAMVLVSIFITLLFTVKSEKHSIELDTAIRDIKEQAKSMESFIQDEYKLPISEAIKELEKLKGSMIKVIFWFSKHID